VLTSVPAKDQNVASAQQPVAVIGSVPLMEVYVAVRDVGNVKAGDQAEILISRREGEQNITTRVVSVAKEAETKLSALGVQEGRVRVLLEPESAGLEIGYIADVVFTAYRQENALTVPKTALFTAGDEDFVWLISGGVLKRQPVTKGQETRTGYIITDGLGSGDVVVTDANNTALKEGKRARG